jgi:2',3'-cyclic-nucleotide 2'-phosphodiesterase (5'-nucleotidase family)
MATFIKQQRLLDPDLLLLNAGDDIIGTEWDRKAGVDAPAAFMNLLGPDAMVSTANGCAGMHPGSVQDAFMLD